MNARLYARVSRDEQVKYGYSIDAQLASLKEYCNQNKITISGIYVDEGISAATTKKRKDYLRMMNDLEENDIILFTKLDRFSRNLLDANLAVLDLEKKNVSIKAIHEDDIDTSTADGKFIFNLKLSLAEREREKTSERINDVFKFMAKNGQRIGSKTPFGYRIENKRYVRDDKKAGALLDAYNLVITHRSVSYANKLFNEKYPEYRMEYSNFLNRLKNEINIGKHKYNDHFCEGIIPADIFEQVQNIVNNNNIRTRANNSIFLFSGLVKCDSCGRKMVGNKVVNKKCINPLYYYRCNHAFQNKICSNRHIFSEKKIEKYLLDNLNNLLEEYVVDLKTKEQNQKDYTNDIKKIKNKMTKLKDLYLEDMIQKDDYEKSYKQLDDELKRYSQIKPISIPKAINDIINVNIKECYKTLDRKQKQALWQSIIKEIVMNEDKTFVIYFV